MCTVLGPLDLWLPLLLLLSLLLPDEHAAVASSEMAAVVASIFLVVDESFFATMDPSDVLLPAICHTCASGLRRMEICYFSVAIAGNSWQTVTHPTGIASATRGTT
jgi:hypothetical protein